MKVCIAKYLYALIMILVFTAATAFGQVKVVHFNASWNEANDVEWFAIVPTIVVFDDGEEVKRFQADISFKMSATREEIQEYIDELIISKF